MLHFQEVEFGFFGAAALEAGEDFAVGMNPAEELGGDGGVVRVLTDEFQKCATGEG